MTYLVTGATGKAGGEVVRALLERGVPVRALVRDPDRAHLPAAVEVVRGDLTAADDLAKALAGVDGAFLLSAFLVPEAADVVDDAGVRRVVLLWAGFRGPVEEAFAAGSVEWTSLEPVSFLGNTVEWAERIRAEGVVAAPFVDVVETMVDERDVGEVAAAALLEEGHAGRRYQLTGPHPVSVRDRVAAISARLGRPLRLTELTEEQARHRWADEGYDAGLIDALVDWQKRPVAVATLISPSVPRVLGRPAGTFEDWLDRHVAEFRADFR